MAGGAERDEIGLLVVVLLVVDVMYVQFLADLFPRHMTEAAGVPVPLANLRRHLPEVR